MLEQERDQLVLWLPVAFGTGIGLWFLISQKAGWIALILVAAAFSLFASGFGKGRRLGRALSLFGLLLACGCLCVWWRAVQIDPAPIARPEILRFSANVERVERLVARDQVRLTLAPAGMPGLPRRVRLNVETDKAPATLAPGARIIVRARLVPPPGPLFPGGYDFARAAWFQGIGATGRALDPVVSVSAGRSAGPTASLAAWRDQLTLHVERQLPGSAGGIAAAFVTGDQGAIGAEDAAAMRASGLAHLLSISGLHVSVVIGGVMLLVLRLLALSPRLALHWPLPAIAAAIGALAGICYTLLAGAEVPTLRSCIAALLVLAALMMGREAMTLRLVAAGAFAILLFRPEALVGASFQLSFAAVVAIVAVHGHPAVAGLLRRREEGHLARLLRGMTGLLLTGLVVELVLAPIALFHFHRTGLYGALANLVAIPLTSFLIMPAEALALLLDLAGLGTPLWWVTGKAIALLLGLAQSVSQMPGASASLPSMPVGTYLLIVAGGLWIGLWRSRMRWLGLGPLLLGLLLSVQAAPADVLVSRDGRHVALRTPVGMALLRPRTGDFTRDQVAEIGTLPVVADMAPLAEARCSPDLCHFRSGQVRLLATRSSYQLDRRALVRSCAAVDIAISDRRLPRGCRPRWVRIDPVLLSRTGGIALWFKPFRILTTQGLHDDHPWLRPRPAAPAKSRPLPPGRGPLAGSRAWRP